MNSKSPNQASFTYIVYFPGQKIYIKVEKNPFYVKSPTVAVTAFQYCALCQRCGERLLQDARTSSSFIYLFTLGKIFNLFGHARSLWRHAGSSPQRMESFVAACEIWFPDQGSNLGPLHWA